MAIEPRKESMIDIVNRNEKNRNLTRNFLLDAFKVHCLSNGLTNGLSRYYQVQINSLINRGQEDVDYLLNLAENNTRCIKCGSSRKIKIRNRRNKNKSSSRKYCRYLRSLCDFVCDKCHHCKTFKSKGRKNLKNITKSIPQPKLKNPKQPIPTVSVRQPTPSNSIAQRNLIGKPKQQIAPRQKQQPIVTKPKQQPNFSSRLRPFSCLLKE